MKKDSDDVNVLLNQAGLYMKVEKYEQARSNYEYAITISPYYSSTYNRLGLLYYSLKEYDKAIQNYSKAIQLDQYSDIYLMNRGNAYFKQQRY